MVVVAKRTPPVTAEEETMHSMTSVPASGTTVCGKTWPPARAVQDTGVNDIRAATTDWQVG